MAGEHQTQTLGTNRELLEVFDKALFDAAWPVYAACFVQRIWASSEQVRLGPFLRESGLLEEAGPRSTPSGNGATLISTF